MDDSGRMQQRVMKLAMYNDSPEERLTNQMSDHLIHALEEVLDVPRHLIKVFTRDGVYLNDLCMLKLIGGPLVNPNDNRNISFEGLYSSAFNIKCMSHTLDLCGADYTIRGTKFNRIEGPNARKIYKEVNGLFSGPGSGVSNDWYKYVNTAMPSVSPTRWWSREEFWAYLLTYLKFDEGDQTKSFHDWIKKRVTNLREEKKSVGSHMARLEAFFVPGAAGYDEKFLLTSYVEIAVVVDVSKKVREATYIIEGDGPIAVIIMEILDCTNRYYQSTYEDMDYPNVRRLIAQAVALKILPPGYVPPAIVRVEDEPPPVPVVVPAEEISERVQNSGLPEPLPAEHPLEDVPLIHVDPNIGGLAVAWDYEEAWKEYCHKISEPYMNYFNEMVMGHDCLSLWRAASMADPLNMRRKTLTARELRDVVKPLTSKLVSTALIDRMVAELSEYERACMSIDWSNDEYNVRLKKIITFWSTHKLLPAWTEFAHLVFLLQPTSACVERAFSILKYIMGDQQVRSLRDKVEASLMLRFNRGLQN